MRTLLLISALASLVLTASAQTKRVVHTTAKITAPAPAPAPTPAPAPAPATTVLTARAAQAQGKYVFCYAQPTAAYDVAFSFATQLHDNERISLNTVVGQMLTAAQLEAGAQLKPFDAILMQAGQRDLAIKFRDNVPQDQRALATVQRVEGKPMFIFCEPVADYQVVKTEKISWYNHAFGGAYYTFGKVEENLLRTAKKDEKIEAVLFGETATYISWKK